MTMGDMIIIMCGGWSLDAYRATCPRDSGHWGGSQPHLSLISATYGWGRRYHCHIRLRTEISLPHTAEDGYIIATYGWGRRYHCHIRLRTEISLSHTAEDGGISATYGWGRRYQRHIRLRTEISLPHTATNGYIIATYGYGRIYQRHIRLCTEMRATWHTHAVCCGG